MKKVILAAVLATIVFTGAYFGSAYWSAHNLRESAIEGDVDGLEARVDFPAVRESLKSQLNLALASKLKNDPEMKDNPFAGLGMMLAPIIVDRAIETYVTADGLAAMARGEKPGAELGPGNRGTTRPDLEYDQDWIGMDRFRTTLRKKGSDEMGPSFIFERRGLFSWKLVKIELAAEMLSAN